MGSRCTSTSGSKLEFIDGDGNLDAEDVDSLVPRLAATTATPNDCHYGLWQGWGWMYRGSMVALSSGPDAAGVRTIEQAFNEAMTPVWTFARSVPNRALVGRSRHDPV